MSEEAEKIIISQSGRLGHILLNRPKALNAIDDEMIRAMGAALDKWRKEPVIYAVVIEGAGERAFCAGADVRALRKAGLADRERACEFFRLEYGHNWRLERFNKPYVALMDGIVMGGGAGISLYGTHKVAGENYSFAMPETAIGLFPDVGATYFLSHLPNSTGLYLGLSGRSIGRDDAFHLGLVSHLIPSSRFGEIKEALAEGEPVDALLDDMAEEPGEGELKKQHGWIEAMFSPASLPEIFRLGEELARRSNGWSARVLDELRSKSPTSLHLTLALWKKGRQLNLRRALELEYNVACNLMHGGDFYEGVRARLVDRDNDPVWQPAVIEEVAKEDVERLLEPAHGHLQLPG